MQDVKRYISPYHHSLDPVRDFENHLEEAGFEKHVCEVLNRKFTFPSFNVLKREYCCVNSLHAYLTGLCYYLESVKAISPFLSRMPEHLKEDYLADYIREVRNVEHVHIETTENNNEEMIHCQYKLFIIYASKS